MSYLLDKAMVPPRQTDFLLDAQPPELQEAFQFLLATAMHEAGNFGEFQNFNYPKSMVN